jgi:hypothetical protein
VIPTQQSLDTMMDRAYAFRVIRAGGDGHHRPIGERILLESRAEARWKKGFLEVCKQIAEA